MLRNRAAWPENGSSSTLADLLVLTVRRFIFFWDGMPRVSDVEGLIATKNLLFLATSVLAIWGLLLAWKRRIHGVFLFAALLIFYPLVYYVCFPELRYRHPIDPELLILGVYLVSETRSATAAQQRRRRALPSSRQARALPQFHTLSVIVPGLQRT